MKRQLPLEITARKLEILIFFVARKKVDILPWSNNAHVYALAKLKRLWLDVLPIEIDELLQMFISFLLRDIGKG